MIDGTSQGANPVLCCKCSAIAEGHLTKTTRCGSGLGQWLVETRPTLIVNSCSAYWPGFCQAQPDGGATMASNTENREQEVERLTPEELEAETAGTEAWFARVNDEIRQQLTRAIHQAAASRQGIRQVSHNSVIAAEHIEPPNEEEVPGERSP
jgi:hypothetical protein